MYTNIYIFLILFLLLCLYVQRKSMTHFLVMYVTVKNFTLCFCDHFNWRTKVEDPGKSRKVDGGWVVVSRTIQIHYSSKHGIWNDDSVT